MTKAQWRMVGVLTAVVAVVGLLLAIAYQWSRAPIARAREEALHRMLLQVLPPHDNAPARTLLQIDGRRLYVARSHGRVVGYAWSLMAPDGYGGPIEILLGVRPDGAVEAIRVVRHLETPGLGDGIVRNRAWLDSFVGRRLEGTRWAVRKDGGDFDQFTGATISPRAVVAAVARGLRWFRDHRAAVGRAAAR
ncbi:MAG: RnfABCDGE type electron transport complex subunit G [Zetaproteobacteria bacterium]|nr:MAG: RnfABCDGE type electron transport complex subunit G [Zetaproteobacteria bacterium]